MLCSTFRFFFFVFACLFYSSTPLPADNFITPPNGNAYPVRMIDPVVFDASNGEGIVSFFKENGYVIVDRVSEQKHRDDVVQLMDQIIEQNIPLASRLGFMDLYHDDSLAQLRQNPNIYQVFTKLFEDEKLWVVFDRVIYQNPSDEDYPLNPHVDQNPIQNPEFFNVQAMIALKDMNESTGTLALVPQSPQFFLEYVQWTKPGDGYVEHQGDRPLYFVALRLKEGQLVIWDSRTTHSRFRGEAKSNRYAALVTYTLAKDDPILVNLRLKYFQKGIGWNNHEAGLRATSRPRCEQSLRQTPEALTDLGRRLYGLDSWFE